MQSPGCSAPGRSRFAVSEFQTKRKKEKKMNDDENRRNTRQRNGTIVVGNI